MYFHFPPLCIPKASTAAPKCDIPAVAQTSFVRLRYGLRTSLSKSFSRGRGTRRVEVPLVARACGSFEVSAKDLELPHPGPCPQYPRRAAISAMIAGPFSAAAAVFAEESEVSASIVANERVYFDVAIDGESVGRVVIECASNVGGQRLLALAKGEEKDDAFITYLRRLEVVNVSAGANRYVETAPLRALSNLDGSAVFNLPGGEGGGSLRAATTAEKEERKAEGAGAVWLRAFDDESVAPKQILVSRNGKLVLEAELGVPPPNGTAVTLCTGACGAALSGTHAYAGRIIDGIDVVTAVNELPTVPVNRKLKYGSTISDINAPRQNRTFKKVTLKAGIL